MKRFALLLLCGTLAACVEVQSTRTSPVQYPAIRPEEVYVFQSEREVPGAFESVGIIYTRVGSGFQNEAKQIDAAKKRAAEMGANGIIFQSFSEAGVGARVAQALVGVPAFNKGQVLAIHFSRGRTSEPTVTTISR